MRATGPEAVGALAMGDPGAWQALFEALIETRPAAASPAFVEAALARLPSYADWEATASRAAGQIVSSSFTTVATALRPFRAWFSAGLLASRPPGDPVALECRLLVLLQTTQESIEPTAQLAADVRQARPGSRLLADALQLLARRALELRAFPEALEAAAEAEQVFTALGEASLAKHAARQRAAALFHLGRFDEAFALTDALLTEAGPLFGGGGAHLVVSSSDPVEAALDELTAVLMWADEGTPEWVRALGGLAQRRKDQALWARFERALDRLVARAEDPAEALEVVIRQASQRRLLRTAKAARARLATVRPGA